MLKVDTATMPGFGTCFTWILAPLVPQLRYARWLRLVALAICAPCSVTVPG